MNGSTTSMLFARHGAVARATTSSLALSQSSRPVILDAACARLRQTQPPSTISIRHASHGTAGRANGPKNGPGKRLGAKKTGDEYVIPGNIIFRQRGTLWHPGENVGLGRDHTIFATASGYVKYYRNPRLDPKKRYIGVVFEKSMMLPTPTNAARRRKLGMVAVPRQDIEMGVEEEGMEVRTSVDAPIREGGMPPMSADPEQSMSVTQAPSQTKADVRAARARTLTGRPPTSSLTMSRGNQYSFRESNYSIGRAAERAGLQVKQFVKGDRFLAWRKKEVRKTKNAERRSLGKKKGSTRAGKAVRKA